MRTISSSWRSWLACWLGIVVVGCQRQHEAPIVPAKNRDAPSFETGSQDHLQLALSFIDTLNEYDEGEIVGRIGYHLQKWIKDRQPDEDWVADPLFGRLPQRLRLIKSQAALSRLVFVDSDVTTLREAMWLRDIARQINDRPVGDLQLAQWLEENIERLTPEVARDLGTAYQAFDWIVRNVQPEPPSAADGIPYSKRLAWEALLLGRGDDLVRSRLFILLARQLGIPVVMLASEDAEGNAHPWLPAAFLGGQLYLFDMQLGLPVPADGTSGIATLDQLLDQPQLLEELTAGSSYRINADDLKTLVALVDASPAYLSQRMRLVEKALTGDDKMRLTCRPSVLGRELRSLRGITNVAIWPFSYDSLQQRLQLRNNVPALQAIQAELALVSGRTALARGRLQHLRGQIANQPNQPGAKAYYLQSRPSDQQIEATRRADNEITALLQARGLPDDAETRARIGELLQQQLRQAKQLASYWLGLLAFEQNQFDVAVDFFQNRTLTPFPSGIFSAGAAYNLGRCYERWGRTTEDPAKFRQAIEAYRKNDTAAERIRALRLEQETKTAS